VPDKTPQELRRQLVPGKDAQEQRPRFVPEKEQQERLTALYKRKFNPVHLTTRTCSFQSRGESTPNPSFSLTHSIAQPPRPCEGYFSYLSSLSLSLTLTIAQLAMSFESLFAPPLFLFLSLALYSVQPPLLCAG
jgi:hypothetical protein